MGEAAKLISVGRGGVVAHPGKGTTISGYIGHDWVEKCGPDTVAVDCRTIPEDQHVTLAVCGPMVDVDLPPDSRSRPFTGKVEPYTGEARSLDYVSLNVWVAMREKAGAVVYRGEDAVKAFAASISAGIYANR